MSFQRFFGGEIIYFVPQGFSTSLKSACWMDFKGIGRHKSYCVCEVEVPELNPEIHPC